MITNNPRRLALSVLARMRTPSADGDEATVTADTATSTGDTRRTGGAYSNLLLDAAIKRSGIDGGDRALLTRLVLGVTERRITLDYIISALSSRPLARLDADVLDILRLGIYQLRYLDRVPPHAAVGETVSLAQPSGRGFINAILREYTRRGAAVSLPERGNDPTEYLSVAYSLPPELVRRFCTIYGSERAESLFASFLTPPPLTLRANTLRFDTRDALAADMADRDGTLTEPTPYSPWGLRVTSPGLPPAVVRGDAFVQDEASQLCISVLDPQPGIKMLDTCSCPGTKSFSAAMMMKNEGHITSCDLHASKLPLILVGASRLGINIIDTLRRDASVRDDICRKGRFDRILCDVPCSGYGVIAKKPEIRYRPLADADALPEIQFAILDASADALAPGGILVYSTCTLMPAENGGVVEHFLASRPEFVPHDFSTAGHTSVNGQLTLTPDRDATDGFFIAAVRKV